jgi:hypothetical protein
MSESHFATMSMIDSYMGIEDFMSNLYTCDFDIQPTERNRFNFALKVTVPPYPSRMKEEEEFDTQTIKADSDYPSEVTFVPDNCSPEKMMLWGPSVGWVVGTSLKWTQAMNSAYGYAKDGIRTANKQYRNDAWERLSERMARMGKFVQY